MDRSFQMWFHNFVAGSEAGAASSGPEARVSVLPCCAWFWSVKVPGWSHPEEPIAPSQELLQAAPLLLLSRRLPCLPSQAEQGQNQEITSSS